MEEKKEQVKKGNAGLIVVLLLIIVGLGGYIIYDKIAYKNTDCYNDNEKGIASEVDESTNEQATEKETTETETTPSTKETVKELDLSKLDKYKSVNGEYGTIKNINYSINNINIVLSLDGKVSAYNNKLQKYVALNVPSAVDIISFSDAGCPCYTYILTKDGNVYSYNIANIENENYDTEKVENLSNIVRLIQVTYGPNENAGGRWTLLAINQKNEVIEIGTKGV